MKINKFAFGNNLYPILRRKGITIKAFACELGVHYQTLYGWIEGSVNIPVYRLYQISKIVGVSMDDLMRGCDEEAEVVHDNNR